MNLKKVFTAMSAALAVSLAACSSDSSSSAANSEADASSSSAAAIEIPEANGDSLFIVSNFKADFASATELKFSGSVAADLNIDTSVVIDSVNFQLGNASGFASSSDFSFQQLTKPTAMLSIGSVLQPKLNISSLTECGEFSVYLIIYGHNSETNLVATASTTFTRSENQCAVVESSSSSVEQEAELSVWNVTLSTNATAMHGVDLDSKTTFIQSKLAENAALVDLYLVKESGNPVLYTNAALSTNCVEQTNCAGSSVTEASLIAEEFKSGANYVDYPQPAYVSSFKYRQSDLTISASDFELITSYVVITSEYDPATGKGFFVVLPKSPTKTGSNFDMELTVLGNWN